jgi:hypothetical protein
MNGKRSVAETSPAGGARGMHSLLAERPEIGEILRARMQQFPEYAAFLASYGTGVLAALAEGERRLGSASGMMPRGRTT